MKHFSADFTLYKHLSFFIIYPSFFNCLYVFPFDFMSLPVFGLR